MCHYLYLASDEQLPLIPWSEVKPAFNVAELQDYDLEARKQFSKTCVVFLGAYTGCSCGFAYDGEPNEDERDRIDDQDARESVRALVSYLEEQVKRSSLEIFACWNGEQGDPPQSTLNVAPDYFVAEEWPIGHEPILLLLSKA